MKKLIFLFAVTFCLSLGAQKKVIDSKTTFAREALQPYVDRGELPGAISIFYNDGVQETCCIGYANVEKKRPIRLDNVFMQCSQTKGFCGVTIAKLVEEGKLSLDDPVSKYLPEFKELWVLDSDKDGIRTLHKAKNELTVRMVLNHTGGFPFECSAKRNDVRGGGWSGGAPLRQVAAVAAGSPIMFEPGTKDLYSNTGIDIGAAVVEVITGMKWEQYLKKEVLDPLGMKSTWFWPTDKQLKTQVEMYDTHKDAPATYRLENPWEQRPYNDGHVFASAGAGLWTTEDADEPWRGRQWRAHPQGRDRQVYPCRHDASRQSRRLFSRPECSEEGRRERVVRPRRCLGNQLHGQLAQEATQAVGGAAQRRAAMERRDERSRQ